MSADTKKTQNMTSAITGLTENHGFTLLDDKHIVFCTAPRRGLKMTDENADNDFRSEDLEDLISAESLDPLGEPQREKTVPKRQVSKGNSSK